MSPYFDKDFNAWVGPFIMAGINTRVVREQTNYLIIFMDKISCMMKGVLQVKDRGD